MVLILLTDRWIMEDINLCESFYNLQEMTEFSYLELTEFVEEIKSLESSTNIFLISDLIDQFDYIKESISLEEKYLDNMLDYMGVVHNYSITSDEIIERCSRYDKNNSKYLKQMKRNCLGLKKLKKERSDLF